ncbi:MAG: hypothetical protein CFH18_00128 [Alphaproteobacteria bacterium MarineAlpha5_Bin8]|nr:MAG: hypothetical protein CFH17_00084 [Alphaproteobacteria bacterium MarineAlpha5_Bin7]PPR48273.1 MAG: hypothetical protein CFH18_00128 [Alphaproteobacteria bacterium MarineAlpha5_Bin8]PPR55012.1 MAG: hypothetical protein CFH16_00046 [Alphaproteobacteria bacterium MarineAlpha5_Bin6]|tara:strand:- start:194 stop:1834 length:1641 start_codon:yes stop_codon:yes gene_type:complete
MHINLFNKNNLIILIFFVFGIVHWFFFFFFVDYYQYEKHIFSKSDYKNISQISSINNNKFFFNNPYSVRALADKYYKRDYVFFKKILEKKDFKKIFQKKIFTFSDWPNEHNALAVIKYSLENNIIPYHAPHSLGPGPPKDRWMAGPINVITPQIILLKFVDTQTFFFINLLLMYSIGFLGCLLFKYRFNISNFPFFILLLFYNFNGYFVEKIAAYGPHYMGYYILPYCIYFLFVIVNSDYKDKESQLYYGTLFGLAHSLIFYQGTLHLYTITLTFLLFWYFFNFRNYIFLFFSLFFSFSLSSIKLLPAAFAYGTTGNFHYWEGGGYSTLPSIIENMIVVKNIFHYPPFSQWETSLYISVFGLLILTLFVFIKSFDDRKSDINLRSFIFPLILITFISLRFYKHLIIPHWIPLLSSESLTSRYMIIPLLILTFIAIINLNHYLIMNKENVFNKIFIYSSGILCFVLIMNHSRVWRMHRVQSESDWYNILTSNQQNPLLDGIVNNNYNDKLYIYICWAGVAISFFSLILLILCFIYKKSIANKLPRVL